MEGQFQKCLADYGIDVDRAVKKRIQCWPNSSSGWDLQQLDVKNAFLHGELNEVMLTTHCSLRGRVIELLFLIVYVDDIVITGNDSVEIGLLKNFRGREFEIKDLGQLRYFHVVEVARSSKGIFLSQRKYVLDLLFENGLLGCHPSDTPVEANTRVKKI
ncbi:uncharacterized mitochondrial protein AtMg00810-like [Macadamia integrifolia]|uniref:uncharacterized mitochondrial protein AtMg00810-like n=1 Tax=Macadamia integrifolia TaxID=60698 RepID=UPI001C4FEE2E|nr:uncharacterized mitochondrial protein AtMg00810-like [Macadamia integrifolia]